MDLVFLLVSLQKQTKQRVPSKNTSHQCLARRELLSIVFRAEGEDQRPVLQCQPKKPRCFADRWVSHRWVLQDERLLDVDSGHFRYFSGYGLQA